MFVSISFDKEGLCVTTGDGFSTTMGDDAGSTGNPLLSLLVVARVVSEGRSLLLTKELVVFVSDNSAMVYKSRFEG